MAIEPGGPKSAQNRLAAIPKEIGKLHNLRRLELDDNPMGAIPKHIIERLTKLEDFTPR